MRWVTSVLAGTGLHTFVLYLGPFVAKTTLAAYECQSLNFATEGTWSCSTRKALFHVNTAV
jgi:hypothetical protein